MLFLSMSKNNPILDQVIEKRPSALFRHMKVVYYYTIAHIVLYVLCYFCSSSDLDQQIILSLLTLGSIPIYIFICHQYLTFSFWTSAISGFCMLLVVIPLLSIISTIIITSSTNFSFFAILEIFPLFQGVPITLVNLMILCGLHTLLASGLLFLLYKMRQETYTPY